MSQCRQWHSFIEKGRQPQKHKAKKKQNTEYSVNVDTMTLPLNLVFQWNENQHPLWKSPELKGV